MTTIPTEQELNKNAEEMLHKHPEYKMCGNCAHRDRHRGICEVSGMMAFENIPAALCRHYRTNYEAIVREAKMSLDNDKLELDKIDNLLALAVTTANSTTCFLADMERRVREFRRKTVEAEGRTYLRKDLDMAEEMTKGMQMIEDEMQKMRKEMQEHLDKIDNYYQWYVQSHLNRFFSKDGVFDKFKTDGHLNNSMDVCRILIDFAIGCIGNEENYNSVFRMLRELKNDGGYALTHQDADRYNLQGVNFN